MALAQRPPEPNLHSLRIDPTARLPHGRHWLWSMCLILLLAAVIGGASFWLYPRTIGRPTEVQVVYAQIMGNGAATTGPVLSGAGYVVTGDRYVSIGVRVPGRIDAYEVQEGDFVRKGAVLVRLDNRDYRASLRQAQANLELAQANLALKQKQAQRMKALHARNLIATQELDVADNELAVALAQIHQAEAQMESARVDLDYTTLTAPTDGIVLAKLKEVGEIAVPGGFSGAGDLIRIANLKDLRAEVDINEVDFRRVRLHQQSEVVPDAYPDRKYPAQVVKVYPQANRQKGTIKVEVKLAKVDEHLRPDMSVRINFLAEPVKENGADAAPRITVPKSAVRGTGDSTFVWLVRHEHAAKVPVRVGEDFGENVQVLNGLDGGEAVIAVGAETISEGMRVQAKASDK
ncbi:MAG: efflux RND transporter periplasmic adaptor subunit [Deltaproteobacteria bacterium]|nr:efflux RND transporter periplasmic adaptor subunit [Deltaproteobacteria bacterium]